VLVDESLFAKVSCKREPQQWGTQLRRVMQRMCKHTRTNYGQVKPEALPFAGIGVKDFLPQAQQQASRHAAPFPTTIQKSLQRALL
jgi:hypothetical protein